jgi:ribosomal protein S18 acetylase RimI-like enzyme
MVSRSAERREQLEEDLMQPRIRRGTPADAAALRGLDTTLPVDPARAVAIDRWLTNDHVVVADLDGRVVGYGVFDHGFFGQSNVSMLMVHRDYRGQRIGEHILRRLEALGDTPKFYVTTNQSNHRMQRLLSRMGYRPGGYIHELDPGDPELVFVKDIEIGHQGGRSTAP